MNKYRQQLQAVVSVSEKLPRWERLRGGGEVTLCHAGQTTHKKVPRFSWKNTNTRSTNGFLVRLRFRAFIWRMEEWAKEKKSGSTPSGAFIYHENFHKSMFCESFEVRSGRTKLATLAKCRSKRMMIQFMQECTFVITNRGEGELKFLWFRFFLFLQIAL